MKYKVTGSIMPVVEFELVPGESLFTQSGEVVWHGIGITTSTSVHGGPLKGIGRILGGESFFTTSYTAESPGSIAFTCRMPGTIMPMDVSRNRSLIIQKNAFLCAQKSVKVETIFTKKFSSGLFGGEDYVLQRLSGSGMAFLEVGGDTIEKRLGIGEIIKVDIGNMVALEDSVNYEMETINSLGNIVTDGKGLFLTRLSGPGKVILQTLNFKDLAGKILSLEPSRRGK